MNPCIIVRTEKSVLCGVCHEFRSGTRDFVCPRRKTAMTASELRAMTAQGPAVVMVARDDMLRLLDEQASLQRETERSRYVYLGLSFALAVVSWVAVLAVTAQ